MLEKDPLKRISMLELMATDYFQTENNVMKDRLQVLTEEWETKFKLQAEEEEKEDLSADYPDLAPPLNSHSSHAASPAKKKGKKVKKKPSVGPAKTTHKVSK